MPVTNLKVGDLKYPEHPTPRRRHLTFDVSDDLKPKVELMRKLKLEPTVDHRGGGWEICVSLDFDHEMVMGYVLMNSNDLGDKMCAAMELLLERLTEERFNEWRE